MAKKKMPRQPTLDESNFTVGITVTVPNASTPTEAQRVVLEALEAHGLSGVVNIVQKTNCELRLISNALWDLLHQTSWHTRDGRCGTVGQTLAGSLSAMYDIPNDCLREYGSDDPVRPTKKSLAKELQALIDEYGPDYPSKLFARSAR
jgi:hypothetical protein